MYIRKFNGQVGISNVLSEKARGSRSTSVNIAGLVSLLRASSTYIHTHILVHAYIHKTSHHNTTLNFSPSSTSL